MLHIYVIVTLAHRLLSTRLLWSHMLFVLFSLTGGDLLNLVATALTSLFLCRLFDAGYTASLGCSAHALLLLL